MKAKYTILLTALTMPVIQAADINVFGTIFTSPTGPAPAHADNAYQKASFESTSSPLGVDGGLGTNIRVIANSYTAGSSTNSVTVTWTKDNNYFVSDRLYIPKGATLIIEAGTKVYFSSDDNATTTRTDDRVGSIVACRGGKLIANGTAAEPIVFTSVREWEAANNTDSPIDRDTAVGPAPTAADAGQWGGIVLLGQAIVTSYSTAPALVSTLAVEGFTPTGSYVGADAIPDATQYGSDVAFPRNDDDNSGIVRYVSIRHGGYEFDAGKEINGLTLGGVGRQTTIENVEVFANQDDGIEFFGGTVNTRNIVMAFNQDDSFDMDEGYNGTNQFWFSIQNPGAADGGFEADGVSGTSGTSNANFTTADTAGLSSNPKIYNATIIGPGRSNTLSVLPITVGSVNTEKGNHGMIIEDRFAGEIYNSVFDDFSGDLVRFVDPGVSSGAKFKFQNNVVGRFGNVAQRQIESTTFAFTAPNTAVLANASLAVEFKYGPSSTAINLTVPVTAGMTANQVATEIRTALLANSTIAGLYNIIAGPSAGQNLLLSIATGTSAQDANLNVAIAINATAGSAAAALSANTQAATNAAVDITSSASYLNGNGNTPSGSDLNHIFSSSLGGAPLFGNTVQNTDPMFLTYTRNVSSVLTAINPVPQVGSPLLTGATTGGAPTYANYRGAFGTSNWAAGWTRFSQLGVLQGSAPSTIVDVDGDGIDDVLEATPDLVALGFSPSVNNVTNHGGTPGTSLFDSLYTATSIQNLRGTGLMIGPVTPGGNAQISLPLFSSPDLSTWTAAGTATATVATPPGKQFFRIDLSTTPPAP